MRNRVACRLFAGLVLAGWSAACVESGPLPSALAPSAPRPQDGAGPAVVFDPLRLPDPEVPFPSDFACAYDPTSPTLCRPNLATAMTTEVESRVKRHVDLLTGFSTYGPISVSFEGPLDLASVSEATVLVLKVPPGDEEVARVAPVPLDLGEGAFPMNQGSIAFYPNDPYAAGDNLAFPPDNVGDTDGDGDPEYLWHYEVSTNTLLIRPLLPLDERSKYAVILTRGLRGFAPDGLGYGAVRSPFSGVNHPSQTRDLERLLPVLDRLGLAPEDIAFAWTFTTQDVTSTVRAIREGLYGRGTLGWLDGQVSRRFLSFDDSGIPFDGSGTKEGLPLDPQDNIVIVQAEFLNGIVNFIAPLLGASAAFDFSFVDYFAFGWMESPDFQATPDRVFDVDLATGRATWAKAKVPIMVAVPKVQPGKHEPPFPVVLYAHGNGTSRLEGVLLSNALARYGLAVVSMDEVGYGPLAPDIPALMKELGIDLEADPNNPLALFMAYQVADILLEEGQAAVQGLDFWEIFDLLDDIGFFQELLVHGRAMDHNHDGRLYNGEGFFVPFPFEQRDVFRQMQVDYMTLVRLLRSLSQDQVPPAVPDPRSRTAADLMPNLVAGDLNADGVLDIGGPDVPFYMAGTSLGGIVTVLVTGVEPEITAAAPLVGGAGLVDVFTRSRLRGFFDEAFYFVMGPVLASCPAEDGLHLTFNATAGEGFAQNSSRFECRPERLADATVHLLPPGLGRIQVEVRNLHSGDEATAVSDEAGGFAVAVPSDIGDEWRVRVKTAAGEAIEEFVVTSPFEGLGLTRNSPRFRRNVGVFQAIIDPADPANWAPMLLRRPPDGRPRNILQSAVIADSTIPCGAQLAMARILGLLGLDDATMRDFNRKFVAAGIPQGQDFDVDDLGRDNGGFGPLPVVQTATGQSAVRFVNVHGDHEYMAIPNPASPFDWAQYTHNMIALFLHSGGTRVEDSLCIESNDCPCVVDPDLPCE